MWEAKYAKEPFDLKLVVLCFAKKIWIPILAAFIGAAVFGGGYFVKNVVFGGPVTFEMTSQYYVEYGIDPQVGNEYTYINSETWNGWVTTDYFIQLVLENENVSKYALSKTDFQQYFSATLATDLRIPSSKVVTQSKEMTADLGKALEEAFVAFGEKQKEINEITVVDSTEVTQTKADIRTMRATILGGLIGLFFACVIMLLYFLIDDSIYVPATFSYRYGIPMLGVIFAGLKTSTELEENISYVLGKEGKIAVTALEPEIDLTEAAQAMNLGSYVCVPSPEQLPEAARILREAEKVVLLIEAGAHNGKRIETLLQYLKTQDCKIDGAVLYNGDEHLIAAYCYSGFRGVDK